MNLGAYLERIHYQGSLRPTLETLTALHQAHLLAIPYENLDIHLGRRLVLEERRLFEKIALERQSILTLRGAVFKTLALEGASQHVLKTEEEYKTAMAEVFGLEVDTSRLWPRVWARHLDWVRSQEAI